MSSTRTSLNELSSYNIGLEITNKTDSSIPFKVSETTLFVNDKRSFSWDMAAQNGTLVNLQIAPRKTKIIKWPLGNAIFPKTGTYDLKLKHNNDVIKEQRVIIYSE